ncbi:hypothetical protein [Streptomyces sp. AcE210]|uniref:hypothetical protein n=1 Tax=Streptomyces sp. AcE210 TaxID=2292703 RepID=UPI001F0CB290|nr:hypothetical protein [Streptomyces sp. AcE210]
MVLAIPFLETPLKFRAPGVPIPIGLGIGRLVSHARNLVEATLAVVVIVAVAAGGPPAAVFIPRLVPRCLVRRDISTLR